MYIEYTLLHVNSNSQQQQSKRTWVVFVYVAILEKL